MYGELDGTFPNHPADPLQPANQRDLRARVVSGGVRHRAGLRRRRRPRVRRRRDRARAQRVDHHGDARRAMLRTQPGRDDPAQPDLLAGRARGDPRARRRAGAHQGRSLVHQADDGRDRRGVRRRALGALLLRPQLPRRQRADRFAARASTSSVAPSSELSVAAQAVRALRRERRDQHPRRRSGGRDRRASARSSPSRRQDRLDGLTVDCGSWWFNLRPSNTEPLLRLNLEAADPRRVRRPRGRGLLSSLDHAAADGGSSMALDPTTARRSSPAPRTRARCTTSSPRTVLYNPRLQRALRRPRRHPGDA